MKKIGLTLLVIFLAFNVHAQTIELKRGGGKLRFYQEGQRLSMGKVSKQLQVNPNAAKVFRSAHSMRVLGTGFSGIGGALMGYPLGGALAGKKMDWKLFGVGAGLAIITIPIYEDVVRKSRAAIDVYNKGLPYSSWQSPAKTSLSLISNQQGVGFDFRF